MKKRIILLSGIILLSFFMVTSVVAQEKTQDVKKKAKAKTEMVKKDISSKCKGCPTLDKCDSEAALKAKKEKEKACEGKVEKPVTTNKKKKAKKK